MFYLNTIQKVLLSSFCPLILAIYIMYCLYVMASVQLATIKALREKFHTAMQNFSLAKYILLS